jgi:tRNA U55 pseudouridine synthase TruB
MRETLDMAMELNCEFANFYSAMAYPGSRLYDLARENGWRLPASWQGYSQHAYECLPLPAKYVSAAEVLRFRDDAFHDYFANPAYLCMIEVKFGRQVREHIERISSGRLKRRILGD